MNKLDVVARAHAAAGTKSAKVKATLEAGNYALVCFLPVAKSGPPHAARGMAREFEVT
jgi:hypothetical protein